MAIPENIAAALADKADVLEFVKGLDAKADKFTPDIEKALPDLAKLPELQTHSAALAKILAETKAKDADTLLTDFKNIVSVKEDLLRQKETWKANGKGADSPEYKALEEKIAEIQKASEDRIKAIEDESKANKDAAAKAVSEKRETDLKSSILTAASKEKIRDPEDEWIILKAKGLVGHKEDGTPFYHKLNDKGEKVDAQNPAALMKWYAETYQGKVDPSSKGGTGQDHRGGEGGGDSPKTASEARKAFFT